MLTRIQDMVRVIGKQIRTRRNAARLKLTPYARTELTWARRIDGYENIPGPYRDFFASQQMAGQPFPYTVITPACETFELRITSKLICAYEDGILFLEQSGNGYTEQYYPFENISCVEVSSMLLDSRLTVNGINRQGLGASSTVRFSSSTDYLIAPLIQKMRRLPKAANVQGQITNLEQFDQWIDLNFKFMNLSRHSLMEGEKVIQAVLQPEVRESRFKLFGKTFYRMITPTHACILTNSEMILIREEALRNREDKYGAIWEYIPLNKITDLILRKRSDNLLVLSILLRTSERFELLFHTSMKDAVDHFVTRLHKLKS